VDLELEWEFILHIRRQVFVVPNDLPPNKSQIHFIPLIHGTWFGDALSSFDSK